MADRWSQGEVVGDLIARVRGERGMTQDGLAEALMAASGNASVDRGYVSRWETGRRIPDRSWLPAMSVVLDVPVDVLARAVAVARTRRREARPVHELEPVRRAVDAESAAEVAPALALVQGDSSRTLEEILQEWDGLMRRRDLLALGGGAAVMLLPDLGAAGTIPRSVSEREGMIDACAALTATYRRLDNLRGPRMVYAQVMGHCETLRAWLRQVRDPAERRQVGVLAADVADLAAWLYFDLELYGRALEMYRFAAEAAGSAEDVSRQAYLVGRMSRTLSECNQHQDAAVFADRAVALAGTGAAPVVRSWLRVTRAYVHASLGEERACRDDLETAATLLGRKPEAQPEDYIAFYDVAHLHKWRGHALLKLGEQGTRMAEEGAKAVDRACESWSAAGVRESAEVLTGQARARIAQREVSEAARLTGQAYRIALQTQSPRNVRHIRNVRARLHPYRHTRAVRDLDELLFLGQ